MKTLSCRCASVVIGLSFFLSASPLARAAISVVSTNSFGSVTIDPASGSVNYTTALQSSAFSQAGANARYNVGASSTAGSMDVPVTGGLATGAGKASASLLVGGSSGATGFIPDATPGFDTSTGRAAANGQFMITGTGSVSVTFSAVISGQLTLSSDAYGVFGQGENVFALSVNGVPILFNDQILSIGPSQSANASYSETLTDTMTLMADTTYYLWV